MAVGPNMRWWNSLSTAGLAYSSRKNDTAPVEAARDREHALELRLRHGPLLEGPVVRPHRFGARARDRAREEHDQVAIPARQVLGRRRQSDRGHRSGHDQQDESQLETEATGPCGLESTAKAVVGAGHEAGLLQAVELPPRGGDTLFADARAAFEAFSPAMQALLLPLTGIYTAALVHDNYGAYASVAGADRNRLAPTDVPSFVEHPLIRTHPVTGRRCIFSSLGHTERIKGMTVEESRPLLEFLARQTTRAEFCTRLNWRPGTLALWDNRSVQHYPLNDYPGHRREMHRVILKGERPQ